LAREVRYEGYGIDWRTPIEKNGKVSTSKEIIYGEIREMHTEPMSGGRRCP